MTAPHSPNSADPLDDPIRGAPERGFGRLFLTLIAALAVALVFNAEGFLFWVGQLPPSPFSDALYTAASDWRDAMARIGLSSPYAALDQAADRARTTPWP